MPAEEDMPMDPEIAASMDELKQRVERQRAAGVYGAGEIREELVDPNAPALLRDLAAVARLSGISPAHSPPSAPDAHGVRAMAARARTAARDAARRPVGDVADRATAFNTALVDYLVELAREVVALRAEVERLSRRTPGSG